MPPQPAATETVLRHDPPGLLGEGTHGTPPQHLHHPHCPVGDIDVSCNTRSCGPPNSRVSCGIVDRATTDSILLAPKTAWEGCGPSCDKPGLLRGNLVENTNIGGDLRWADAALVTSAFNPASLPPSPTTTENSRICFLQTFLLSGNIKPGLQEVAQTLALGELLGEEPTRDLRHPVLPHIQFLPFLGRPLFDVRFYHTRNFGHLWAPSLVTLLIF